MITEYLELHIYVGIIIHINITNGIVFGDLFTDFDLINMTTVKTIRW